MSQKTYRLLFLVAFMFLAGLAVSSWLSLNTQSVNAQATTQKLFVHCETAQMDNPPQYMYYILKCTTEDGVPFAENGTTPSATQRFYVTDIILASVSPTHLTHYSGGNMVTELKIGARGSGEQLVHFTSPYFVLQNGNYLYTNGWLYASGYVISNQTFLPNISK